MVCSIEQRQWAEVDINAAYGIDVYAADPPGPEGRWRRAMDCAAR